MLANDQIIRNLSGKMNKSTKELYSAGGVLSETDMDNIKRHLDLMSKYPIFYVDTVGTVNQIEATIRAFIANRQLLEKKKGLVVTLDHVLLTKGKEGAAEKQVVDSLMHKLVELKKTLVEKEGMRVLFIVLSQLNRDIEKPERVNNAFFHYPTKNDIFAASSVYYSSDYVLVTHKPSIVNGIDNFYGPPRGQFPQGLPVYNPYNPDQAMVYWHMIKNRFGENKILMMTDNFANSKVDEWKPKSNS